MTKMHQSDPIKMVILLGKIYLESEIKKSIVDKHTAYILLSLFKHMFSCKYYHKNHLFFASSVESWEF